MSDTAPKCCYRSAIVLDFDERVTYRRCPVHGETEHVYQPPGCTDSRPGRHTSGALQEFFWRIGLRRTGNAVSSLRYWIWRATGSHD